MAHCHSLQVPHSCPDPGALETTLGTPWVTSQQKPPCLCQPELKAGRASPLVSPSLSLLSPPTKPQPPAPVQGPASSKSAHVA